MVTVSTRCPTCGDTYPLNATFCISCGASLAQPATTTTRLLRPRRQQPVRQRLPLALTWRWRVRPLLVTGGGPAAVTARHAAVAFRAAGLPAEGVDAADLLGGLVTDLGAEDTLIVLDPSRDVESPAASLSRLAGALGFTEKPVSTVLMPPESLTTVRRGSTAADVEALCAATGFSRFPVVDDRDGGLLGYLHIKDVLDQLLAGSTNYHALRPDVWKQSHPEAAREYRVEERRVRANHKQLEAARRHHQSHRSSRRANTG